MGFHREKDRNGVTHHVSRMLDVTTAQKACCWTLAFERAHYDR